MHKYLTVMLWFLLALAGCAGHGTQGSPDPAPMPQPQMQAFLPGPMGQDAATALQLPAPAELERGSSVVNDLERLQFGDQYYPLLPANMIGSGNFNPQWTQPADGMAAAAYACYRLGFSGEYDDEARVRFNWLTPPTDYANLYAAVANFSSNRWDWSPCGADGVMLPGQSAEYISPGNAMYVCVLLLGTDPASLYRVFVGSNFKPYGSISTNLSTDPAQNTGPRNVLINASQVEALGGEVTSWDFDFDGDGNWDVLDNKNGLEQHTYNPGEYNLRVRLTESSGKQNILEEAFTIVDPFNQAPTAVLNSDKLLGQAPLQVQLDALSCSDADGYITKYEYDIDFDGIYDIVSTSPDPVAVSFSAFGANSIKLRITDNNFAQSTALLQLTCTTGWQYSVIDSDATLYEDADMAVTGSGSGARACVAYVDYFSAELRFCSAANDSHTSWGTVRRPVGGNGVGLYPGVSITYNSLEDYPMIAYTDNVTGLNDPLNIVRANDTYGTSWKQPQLIDGSAGFGYRTDIEVLNNLPVLAAIATPGEKGLSEVRYYQATDSTGASWSSARVAIPAEADVEFYDIALDSYENGLFDRPLISATCELGPPFAQFTYLVRGSNVDGTAWGTPQKVIEQYCYQTDLLRINGNPAVLSGSSSQSGQLYFSRSSDDSATGFPQSPQLVGPGGNCELDIWGGRPVILSEGIETDGLQLIRAVDADGTAWEEPIPIERRYNFGDHCSLVVVNDLPVVCYVDSLGERLLAAAWKGL
ncbi:MAG: hypothetical protein R3F46_00050 [bacterium]